jgi:uncharacterized protein DUF4128
MAHKEVIETIETKLATDWAPTHCPIRKMNEDTSTPEDGGPFLVVQYPVANEERWSVSHPFYREEGGFRLILNVPRGEGLQRTIDWMDELAEMFRDEKFGDVICQVPSMVFFDDTNDQGAYFQSAIVVPYTFNYRDY